MCLPTAIQGLSILHHYNKYPTSTIWRRLEWLITSEEFTTFTALNVESESVLQMSRPDQATLDTILHSTVLTQQSSEKNTAMLFEMRQQMDALIETNKILTQLLADHGSKLDFLVSGN